MTALRAGSIAVAMLSGMCAFIALAVGSPLQFGVSLALCAAGWIAVDFIERVHAHAPRVSAVALTPLNRGYRPDHVVFAGGGGHISPPACQAATRLAA